MASRTSLFMHSMDNERTGYFFLPTLYIYNLTGQYIRMEVSKRNAPDYGLAGSGKGDYSGYAVEAGHFTGQDLLGLYDS